MSKSLISFIQDIYSTKDPIPLHEPFFDQDDESGLKSVIKSTFVSSVGPLVPELESKISEFTGSNYAIAVVNGTSALQVSLELCGVQPGDEVITQSLTFVASVNAIHHCSASPIFVDVSKDSMGMSPISLNKFLEENCELREEGCWNTKSKKIIKACMPMHTFGFPCEIEDIKAICSRYNILLVEDSAESIGSSSGEKHTGTFGEFGVISFNGNKIITTGAGGVILTNNEEKAILAKHITTTAKLQHKWNFDHDMPAYNFRMPNLNAALGLSQFKKLSFLLQQKRLIAKRYKEWGDENGYYFMQERPETTSNYWLNTLIVEDKKERDMILEETNQALVMTRPAWTPMHRLPFNTSFQRDEMTNTDWLFDRIINVPSGVPKNGI